MNVSKILSFRDNVRFTSGIHKIHIDGRQIPDKVLPDESLSPKAYRKESSMADAARQSGVDIPKYLSSVYGIKYLIKGDEADHISNPITGKHLDNLYDNFFKLEEAGILHKELNKNHVFFSKNGQVEFDSLRYAQEFGYDKETGCFTVFENGRPQLDKNNEKIKLDFPKSMMPSNQDAYMYAGLGEYVESISSESKKKDFVKLYLQKSADYHKARAEKLLEMGIDKNNDMVVREKVQSEILKNPTNDMVNLEIMKFEFQAKRRKADTDWNEGNGNGVNHTVDSKRRIKAANELLNTLELASKFTKKAGKLCDTAFLFEKDRQMQYFHYEQMYGQHWVDTITNQAKDKVMCNFTDDEMPVTATRQEISMLKESFDTISKSCNYEKHGAIQKCVSIYDSLLSNRAYN